MKVKIAVTQNNGEVFTGEIELKKSFDKEIDIIVSDDDPMKTLADACGITIEKLKKVIDFEDGYFVFVGELNEDEFNKKRAIICQCILTAWIKGKKIEWVDNSLLVEVLRKLGMETRNMIRSINTKDGIFRTDGKKSGLKYSLTIPGWKKGLDIIKNLADEE